MCVPPCTAMGTYGHDQDEAVISSLSAGRGIAGFGLMWKAT